MSGVATIAVSIAAAAGAVAAYRFLQRRKRSVEKIFDSATRKTHAEGAILDFERDPGTGVFVEKGRKD